MVKVIEYGQKRRETCAICGAILEYGKNDVKTIKIGMNEYEQQIICPVCDEVVIVN